QGRARTLSPRPHVSLGASSRSCEGQKKSHNGQDKITRESPSRGWRARAKSPTSHELTSPTHNDDLRTPPSGLLPRAWGDVEWLWMGGRMGGWMDDVMVPLLIAHGSSAKISRFRSPPALPSCRSRHGHSKASSPFVSGSAEA